jgi:uncharacterized protein (TIGR03437 family)
VRLGCGLFCALFSWAIFTCAPALAESPRAIPAPLYTPSSIVNAANVNAPPLASNTIATLYGSDLAFLTRGLTAEEIRGGMLPSVLIGTGVRVSVNNIQAAIYYVSPAQINFLVPDIAPGQAEIRVSRDSLYGLAVRVPAGEFSPALFNMDPEFAIATRADGSLIIRDAPARPGEIIILYATGLGATRPRYRNGDVPSAAASLDRINDFRVLVSGRQLERANVLYAGVTPGFPGLYQINIRMPAEFDRNPDVRVGFAEVMSPAGVRLHADSGNL